MHVAINHGLSVNDSVPTNSAEIDPEWRRQFERAFVTPNPDLVLPSPNRYIATDAFNYTPCWPRDKVSYPQLLIDDSVKGTLYHEPLHNYGLPYVDVKFLFQLQDLPERHNDILWVAMLLRMRCNICSVCLFIYLLYIGLAFVLCICTWKSCLFSRKRS